MEAVAKKKRAGNPAFVGKKKQEEAEALELNLLAY